MPSKVNCPLKPLVSANTFYVIICKYVLCVCVCVCVPAGDQLVAEGVTHISLPLHKNTIRGTGENKTDEQTRTMLGVNSMQMESYATLCIPDNIYGLTLAWVTSENSTKLLECRLILISMVNK